MKKQLFTFVFLCIFAITGFAQIPQAINFQAIARDASGNVMENMPIMIRLTVLDGGATGTEVYQELRALTTNEFGSFNFQIGRNASFVTVGTFEGINWETGNKFLKIDYDPTNQFNWNLSMGTVEFVTVPYAFSAGSVSYIDMTNVHDGDVLIYNSVTGKFEPGTVNSTEVDPIFNASAAKNITSTNISNWESAFSWGDHNGLYKPMSYVPAWNDIQNNPMAFILPTNNQLIKYDAATGKWVNWTPNFTQSLSLSNNILSLSNGGGSVTLPTAASQWVTSGSTISYNNGFVGIGTGTTTPLTPLHIKGNSNFALLNNGVERGLFLTGCDGGDNIPAIELRGKSNMGFTTGPYIDFASDLTRDYDARIIYNWHNGNDLGFYGSNIYIEKKLGVGTNIPTSKLQVVGLLEYTDNAAALNAGLTIGAFYRTGDILKVVH